MLSRTNTFKIQNHNKRVVVIGDMTETANKGSEFQTEGLTYWNERSSDIVDCRRRIVTADNTAWSACLSADSNLFYDGIK